MFSAVRGRRTVTLIGVAGARDSAPSYGDDFSGPDQFECGPSGALDTISSAWVTCLNTSFIASISGYSNFRNLRSIEQYPPVRVSGNEVALSVDVTQRNIQTGKIIYDGPISERTIDNYRRLNLIPRPRQIGRRLFWAQGEIAACLNCRGGVNLAMSLVLVASRRRGRPRKVSNQYLGGRAI